MRSRNLTELSGVYCTYSKTWVKKIKGTLRDAYWNPRASYYSHFWTYLWNHLFGGHVTDRKQSKAPWSKRLRFLCLDTMISSYPQFGLIKRFDILILLHLFSHRKGKARLHACTKTDTTCSNGSSTPKRGLVHTGTSTRTSSTQVTIIDIASGRCG